MEQEITEGLWVGDMAFTPYKPSYDAVLTLGLEPGHVDDAIKHRHIVLHDNAEPQTEALRAAATWAEEQWLDGKCVLIRSAGGVNRPTYVVAAMFLLMGADDADEAIESVVRRTRAPLQNDAFIDALMTW